MIALDNAYYIALSFHIPKPDTRAYSVYLQEQAIPFYRLHNEKKDAAGLQHLHTQDHSHKITAEKHGDFPLWNSLHLIQLDQRKSATDLIDVLVQEGWVEV